MIQPFWQQIDFYIFLAIGGGSLIFSWLAFREAKKAKIAATEAGTTVKIQTITVELSELAQRLDKLEMNINFSTARDLLNEITRKLRRMISPFDNEKYSDLQIVIKSLKETLGEAKKSLNEVRPNESDLENVGANIVYYAIEGHLSAINGFVADIIGLLEKRTIDTGE